MVTVVGAGLVGATLALALAERGVALRLVDAQEPVIPTSEPDLRVVALNLSSIDWLKTCGVWDKLDQNRLGVFRSLAIEDQGQTLSFNAQEQGLSKLGVIAENQQIIAAAQQACLKHPNIHCEFSTPFIYEADSKELIIAADGAQSPLRQLLNIPVFTHLYHQKAVVGYVQLELPHQQQAWQIFLPTGPLAFLPLSDPHQASIVWTLPESDSQEITAERLTQASERHYGEIKINSRLAQFPLRLSLSDHYFKDQVVFVGDAIHAIHPLAGQGVNLGFADAQCLLNILMAHDRSQWTQPLVLKKYQRERKPANLLIAHSMSAFNLCFAQEQPAFVTARQWGLKTLGRSSRLKALLQKFVT